MDKKIVLISCVSKKLSYPAKAIEIYTSTLFKSNLKYAYSFKPDYIFILSAKYGLLDLETVIEPYNKTLNTVSAEENRLWANMVISQLSEQVDLLNDHFIFLAGLQYRKNLLKHLQSYEIPLEGLTFGKQLQFLKRNA